MTNIRVFHLMQRAHAALFRAADRALGASVGVSAAQHGVLLVLSEEDGQPISAIADALGLGRPNLSGVVDRMEAGGLVRRAPDDADGRVVRVHLTAAGARVVRRTAEGLAAANARLIAPFTEREREVIARFLHRVIDAAPALVSDAFTDEPRGKRART